MRCACLVTHIAEQTLSVTHVTFAQRNTLIAKPILLEQALGVGAWAGPAGELPPARLPPDACHMACQHLGRDTHTRCQLPYPTSSQALRMPNHACGAGDHTIAAPRPLTQKKPASGTWIARASMQLQQGGLNRHRHLAVTSRPQRLHRLVCAAAAASGQLKPEVKSFRNAVLLQGVLYGAGI